MYTSIMAIPAAYFITWTCYGTWLHGDPRGSVDHDHNVYQTPVIPSSPSLEIRRATTLEHIPTCLCDDARECVDRAIREHAAHRAWTIYALNVRTNHVHLVIAAGVAPETVMQQMKAWSTRYLRKEGYAPRGAAIWTSHGSTRHLWDEQSVSRAVMYVLYGQ